MRQVPRQRPHNMWPHLIKCIILTVSWILCMPVAYSTNITQKSPSAPTRHSYIKHYPDFYLIELYGHSLQQMGFDYGRLLQRPLQQFTASIQSSAQQADAMPYACTVSQQLFQHYPRQWQAFLRAMATGAHLPLSQLLITNSFEHLPIFSLKQQDNLHKTRKPREPRETETKQQRTVNFGCAELFLKPTSQHPAEVMRWYDYFSGHPNWRNKLTITVFHLKDKPPLAMLTYMGTLNATTIFNQNGLFMALNSGIYAAARMHKKFQGRHYNYPFSTIMLLDYFFHGTTLKSFEHHMRQHHASSPLIFNVMSSHSGEIISHEETPYKACTSTEQHNFFVSTNHFQANCWQKNYIRPPLDNAHSFNTYLRHSNLQQQAHALAQAGGQATGSQLKTIMRKPVQAGGASSAATIMQMIYNYRRGIWLRIPIDTNGNKKSQHSSLHNQWQFIANKTLFNL